MYHDDGDDDDDGEDGDDDGRDFFPEGHPQLMYHDDGDDEEDAGDDDDDGRDFLLSGHPQLMYHDERTLSCLHHPCHTPSAHEINKQFYCAHPCTVCFVRFILFCFSLSHYVDCRIFGHCNQ